MLPGHQEQTSNLKSPFRNQSIQDGVDLELKRFAVAEQFPATQQMANVHYKSNMFGLRKGHENRVCPCCLERIKETQFDYCGTNLESSFLSSDVVLFFAFVRMLIFYLIIRFLVSDAYNLYTNYQGSDCLRTIHCRYTIVQRVSLINKITHPEQIFIVDLLNFAFVGISIIFFSSYDRYLYNWFYNMSVSIQTEDDFAVFVTNIPIIQNVDKNQDMEYLKGIETYFTDIITTWLINPTSNRELFDDYLKVAKKHNHAPQSPPRIITRINLCWDLYQLTRIADQKQRIQEAYEKQKQQQSSNANMKKSVIYAYNDTIQNLTILTRANLDLCQQFQKNHYYGFVVSKFLGKAFISFEYEHFALLVQQVIKDIEPFQNHVLKVYDAVPPRDVYWENLNVTRWERFQKLVITFFICAACLVFAFFIVFGIKYQQRKYYFEQKQLAVYKILIITVIVSLFTLLINWILKSIIHHLAEYEQHDTRSNFNIAVIYKTLISVIFNQVLNPFLVNIFLKNYVWTPNGLTTQITYLLFTTLGLQIIKALICPKYIWYWIKLKFNYRNSPPINKFQDNYNAEYALPDFEMHERYLFYIDQIYLIAFYAYLVPFGSLVGVVIFLVQYYADKFFLLKYSSFHPNYSFTLLQKSLILVQTSVFAFALGNYLIGWLYHKTWYQPINLIALALASIYTVMIWIDSVKVLCIRSHTMIEQSSYSDCLQANKFFHTYYSLNPATKLSSGNRKTKAYIGVNFPLEREPQSSIIKAVAGI